MKEEDASNDESTINNIRKFREEFSDALKSDDIKNVVVMIDDLDRCRPERIIEILEVIKLFLSVDRTTFIIAADENVIKYSIREKYPPMNGFDVELDKEYIEKLFNCQYISRSYRQRIYKIIYYYWSHKAIWNKRVLSI